MQKKVKTIAVASLNIQQLLIESYRLNKWGRSGTWCERASSMSNARERVLGSWDETDSTLTFCRKLNESIQADIKKIPYTG